MCARESRGWGRHRRRLTAQVERCLFWKPRVLSGGPSPRIPLLTLHTILHPTRLPFGGSACSRTHAAESVGTQPQRRETHHRQSDG
jgi:hypothetical protein